jgi:DNA-binding NarL/FixJ family response regulator
METSDYVKILKSTAAGKGNWEEVLAIDNQNQESESSIFFSLSPKQRSVMSLTSQGKSAKEIASQLDLSYSYVRKELSRAYGILIPNLVAGDDLKTAAVLKYIELMKIS